ncbi:putative dehydrogenase [Aureibacillus halotolerans]|uniref:Putative dehydrogenase n=2 Tax=Aureibacillus halotolerans TaxID=1508390 RepID=A0A4R6U321_9BACI|nr:putative dehydrogenase [Aureibacillus halotolerans]
MQKVAVVGVNHIGRIHCKVYDQNPDCQLVAVCDLDQAVADRVAAEFQVKAYTDVAIMFQQEDVNLISVATAGEENGSHHYQPVMEALHAGKHVFVEKPISNNIHEAKEMVALAEEKNVYLACDLNHRFVPAAYTAKDWIKRGEIGDILFVNMKLMIRNQKESSPWLQLRALHPHSLDVMRYFAGDVKRVQAFMLKAPGRDIWSTASIHVEFRSGAIGHLTGSYDMSMRHPIEQCEVGGTKGRFVLDNIYEHLHLYPHEKDEATVVRNSIMNGVSGFEETFKRRIDCFIQEMTDGIAPSDIEASGADALAVQLVIEAAIRSHQEGGKVIDVSYDASYR